MKIQTDYFYGTEAEQFAFFKIPKLLFSAPEFKDISIGAKLLYGLMLDRMSLSVITTIYRSYETADNWYSAKVKHDMAHNERW